jgi:hypothetical protein
MAFHKSSQKTSLGLREALRNLKASRRKPDDLDRPPPTPLSGRRTRLIEGQLSLDESGDTDAA